MTENNEDSAADIAWMRRLAEEGSEAPIQGASILMAAGLIFGIASLVFWAEITGLFESPAPVFGISWLVATLVFLLCVAVSVGRKRSSGRVVTAANRAFGTVWAAVGMGIFALFAALMANEYRSASSEGFSSFWLIPSIVMVFYGLGWAVTSAMTRSRPLWFLSVASFVAAPLMALLSGSPDQYLAYAAALFLLMALPGWMLMRRARA